MDILPEYTDAQILELAAQPTPKPVPGIWTLTAPDGRVWAGSCPTDCVIAETNDRIPPLAALARIRRAIIEYRADDDTPL